MGYVLSSIDWHDRLILYDAGGTQLRVEQVTIIGHWNQLDVRVETESGRRLTVRSKPTDAAVRRQLSPGLITYIKNLSPIYFVLASMLVAVSVLFGATRWWWLLRIGGIRVPVAEALRYTCIGAFGNNFVPGQTGGDVVKAIYIMRRCPGNKLHAFLSVVIDRLLGLASLVLLATAAIAFAGERFTLLIIGVTSLLASGLIVGGILFSRRLRSLLRIDILLRKLPKRILQSLVQIDEAIHLYRGNKRGLALWMLGGMLNHSLLVSAVAVLGHGLGVGVPNGEYFMLVPVINIVSAIPIAPQGWGIGEALYGNLFARYGVIHLGNVAGAEQIMRTRAVALSLLYRVILTLISLLGGLFLLSEKQRVTRTNAEQQIAREDTDG